GFQGFRFEVRVQGSRFGFQVRSSRFGAHIPYNAPVLLDREQLLLTLLVKLAVIAVLATMLARYRRFRHILIFERRGWLDRFVFTLSIALPLMAGVTFRKTLGYYGAD